MKDRILIVDDEIDLLQGLKRIVSDALDCEVITTEKARDAVTIIEKEAIDLVLADIIMPDMDGMALLRETRKIDPAVTVILMTAYGTIELAVQAMKDGAYDFIRKPFEEEQLLHCLRKGLERNRLIRENARLQKELCEKEPFQNIVGKSGPMQRVLDTIRVLGRTDVTVLITGESGTGKELAAKAIHQISDRRHQPMVTVNCPAIPEQILESELFGYKKGAFTGATSNKKGLFEEADGGTILLDEIGDLPVSIQTKLLRVLQEKEIKPLGDNITRKIDVRIIASTNQDLISKIEKGEFRKDLYYRLKVASLVMPSLREIREDIPLLVEHFLHKAACEFGIEPKKVSPEALNLLMSMEWPGNVRELENTIRGLTAIVEGTTISPQDISIGHHSDDTIFSDPTRLDLSIPYKVHKHRVLKEFTTKYVIELLRETEGNVTQAARLSGIKRQSLQKIIKKYQIPLHEIRNQKR